MRFIRVNQSFECVIEHIVHRVIVDSPWDNRHKALYGRVGAVQAEVCLRRGWESGAFRVIANDASLIYVSRLYVTTAY